MITQTEPRIGSLSGFPIGAWTEFFWPRVAESRKGCWIWLGKPNQSGYGRIAKNQGGAVLAHRFSWLIHFGEIPDGLAVCHTCDVRLCVNPQHLFLGTIADNQNDAARKRRLKHKITPEVAQAILSMKGQNMSYREISRQTGISRRHIGIVVSGQHRFSKKVTG